MYSGEKGVFFKTSPLFHIAQKFTFLLPELPFLPTIFHIHLSFSSLQHVFKSQKIPENSLTTPFFMTKPSVETLFDDS